MNLLLYFLIENRDIKFEVPANIAKDIKTELKKAKLKKIEKKDEL